MSIPETLAFLRLNVSGRQYSISELIIRQKLDGTLFSSLLHNDNNNAGPDGSEYVEEGVIRLDNKEYFIERIPSLFELVLHYAYTGQLHCPSGVCEAMLNDEVRFWRMPEKEPDACCQYMAKLNFLDKLDDSAVELDAAPELPADSSKGRKPSMPQSGKGSERSSPMASRRFAVVSSNRSGRKLRDFVWRLLDDPSSSWAAKVLHIICIFFILVSITNLVASTVPSLHHCTGHEFLGVDDEVQTVSDYDNSSILVTVGQVLNTTSGGQNTTMSPTNATTPVIRRRTIKDKFSLTCEGGFIFDVIETVCIVWFTIEWLLRFSTCPNKCEFLKNLLNIIDLLATLPYYVELLIWASGAEDNSAGLLTFLRVMRIGRVLRIFRLARYFDSLQVMGETFWNSRSEMGLLVLFLAVSTIIFSTVLFYIERDVEDTKYTSIPASFYWCVVTLTTVGYGDITPSTTIGKVASGCACITGVLIMAFPVSILVEKFRSRYESKRMVRLAKIEKYLHPKSPRNSQDKTADKEGV